MSVDSSDESDEQDFESSLPQGISTVCTAPSSSHVANAIPDTKCFSAFVDNAKCYCVAHEPKATNRATARLWWSVWNNLAVEGKKVLDVRSIIPKAPLFGWVHKMLEECVLFSRNAPKALNLPDVEQMPVANQPAKLVIASGSPGHIGCTDFSGKHMPTDLIFNGDYGIVPFFDRTECDFLGLPAARLIRGSSISGRADLQMYCRRGVGSFDSVAVLWKRRRGISYEVLENIGDERRIWTHVKAENLDTMICIVYFKCGGSLAEDILWSNALSALESDIRYVRATQKSSVIIMGDFNLQPLALGGVPDSRHRRQSLWDKFMDDTGLLLRNPFLGGAEKQVVSFVHKSSAAHIRAGDTHYDSHGGRALDHTLTSSDVLGELLIHNGVHCTLRGKCMGSFCKEFCRSDYFASQFDLEWNGPGSESESMRLPKEWNCPERWRLGLEHAAGPLRALNSICTNILLQSRDAWDYQTLGGRSAARWLLDALAWLQTFIGSVVRDVWIHPRTNYRSHHSKRPRREPSTAFVNWDDPLAVQAELISKLTAQDGVRDH